MIGYVLGNILFGYLLAKGAGKVGDVAGDFPKGAKAAMSVMDDGTIVLKGQYVDDAAKYIDDLADSAKYADVSKYVDDAVEMINPYSLQKTHDLTLSKVEYQDLKAQIIAEGKIKESIKYVEWNGEKYIVDGHHRVKIAKELGYEVIPVEKVSLPYKGYKTYADLIYEGIDY